MSKYPQEYFTRPVPVEAWQITLENLGDVAKWCRGYVKGESIRFAKPKEDRRPLDSTDNSHYAVVGDYIVRKGKGFTVVKPLIFERTHILGRIRA
jgi:hypothetical protein